MSDSLRVRCSACVREVSSNRLFFYHTRIIWCRKIPYQCKCHCHQSTWAESSRPILEIESVSTLNGELKSIAAMRSEQLVNGVRFPFNQWQTISDELVPKISKNHSWNDMVVVQLLCVTELAFAHLLQSVNPVLRWRLWHRTTLTTLIAMRKILFSVYFGGCQKVNKNNFTENLSSRTHRKAKKKHSNKQKSKRIHLGTNGSVQKIDKRNGNSLCDSIPQIFNSINSMPILDSLHTDTKSRWQNASGQMVHEFRRWRETEANWRSACRGHGAGCKTHELRWGKCRCDSRRQRRLHISHIPHWFFHFTTIWPKSNDRIYLPFWIPFYLFSRPQFRNFKIIYRRYAGLYFCICVDVNDNNLCYLEGIHNFVEVLNEYFHNVCELDLVFNFYKVYTVVDEMFLAGEIRETSQTKVLKQLLTLNSLE